MSDLTIDPVNPDAVAFGKAVTELATKHGMDSLEMTFYPTITDRIKRREHKLFINRSDGRGRPFLRSRLQVDVRVDVVFSNDRESSD